MPPWAAIPALPLALGLGLADRTWRTRRARLNRRLLAGLLVDPAHRKLDLAAVVDTQHLDFDNVALVDHIGHLANPLVLELGDVAEPILGTQEIDESAEVDHPHDLAGVDHPDLRLASQAPDPVDRLLARARVGRRNLDRAVVLDVDLGLGGFADLADHFATRADHRADLVLWDV